LESGKLKGLNIGGGMFGRIAVKRFNCVVITVERDEKFIEKEYQKNSILKFCFL